ncbi:MAG: [Desulfovibrionaceae bacterium]|nr:[FeFe] hydrogenase H-cluster maturation GTPase HydF [Desulfovibrionaceae bacterium]
MSLNATPSGERSHIAFFGLRNVGKSSLVNAITNQNLAIVSDTPGTTTDPVQKAMEILPLGPVVIIDTPGLDDIGELGALRVAKAKTILRRTDLAILVTELGCPLTSLETSLVNEFRQNNIPYKLVYSKCDLHPNVVPPTDGIIVSAHTGYNIDALKDLMAQALSTAESPKAIVADILPPNPQVILVIPIDSSAPKGRLILPQQQVLRELLEAKAISHVVQPSELPRTLQLVTPDLVITDSQVFDDVNAKTPKSIPLTSFSILMSRYKGYFEEALAGVAALDTLPDSPNILMAEGCTHHRQCNDIGTVKIPRWLKESTGKHITFTTSSGRDFPEDLSQFDLVVLCGGCMLSAREVQARAKLAITQQVPVTNYGLLIAKMRGILDRSIEIFTHKTQDN